MILLEFTIWIFIQLLGLRFCQSVQIYFSQADKPAVTSYYGAVV